jgi:hypothetical protein
MTRRPVLLLPFAFYVLPFALPAPQSAAAGRIFFSKSFPGSVPACYEVIVESSGEALYREAPDDDQPLRFTLPPADAAAIFGLAGKLQFFSRPLESKLKVANMGMKTLRYEGPQGHGETRFNYSEDADARALVDWFERISETEQHLIALERTARFDRLGINKALLLLETSWDKNRIVAPEQLLPVLDRIARNKSLMHMAQARAASLAERIRARKTGSSSP